MARAADEQHPRLTHTKVVAVALDLLDRHGLQGLTMRALGRALGANPMAVYHYVPNKDALLGAIVEAMWEELELPDARGTWEQQLEELARSFHDVLLRHPHALPIFSTRPNTTAAGLRAVDHTIGILHAAGFNHGDALRIVSAASSFIIGHALAEVGVPPEGTEETPPQDAVQQAATEDNGTNRYPHLTAALITAHEEEGGLMEETFATGLALLIAGARARLAQTN